MEASQTLMVPSLLPLQNRRLGSSTCAGSQEMLVMNLRWPCTARQVAGKAAYVGICQMVSHEPSRRPGQPTATYPALAKGLATHGIPQPDAAAMVTCSSANGVVQ